MKKKHYYLLLVFLLIIVFSYFYFNPKNTFGAVDNCVNKSYNEIKEYILAGNNITYECFGAVGNGTTNDYEAIYNTHVFANKLYAQDGIFKKVYATSGKNYYLGSNKIGNNYTYIPVATDTDWSNANFIVDDNASNVDLSKALFSIISPMKVVSSEVVEYNNTDNNVVSSAVWSNANLTNTTTNIKPFIDSVLEDNIIMNDTKRKYFQSSDYWAISYTNSNKIYIRSGKNSNGGSNQTELVIVNKNNGDIVSGVTWSYDDLTKIRVFPISNRQITLSNGNFTTKTYNHCFASDGSNNPYVQRNIYVAFTGNVKLNNIRHYLDESSVLYTDQYQINGKANGYYGFIRLYNSAYVNLTNVYLTPHTFATNQSNNTSLGTYDLTFDNSSNLYFKYLESCVIVI